MRFRASEYILRRAKTGGFLLSCLMVVSVMSFFSPQSVKAEGFLSRTVRCLFETVLTTECRAATNPTAPTAPAAPAPVHTEPTAYPPTSSGSAVQPEPDTPVQPSTPVMSQSQSSVNNTQAGSALPGIDATHRPIEVQYIDAEGVRRQAFASSFMLPTASGGQSYHYGSIANASVQGASTIIVQPTPQGWLIAGIAWYWWVIGIVAGTALIMHRRHRRIRVSSVLSKAA